MSALPEPHKHNVLVELELLHVGFLDVCVLLEDVVHGVDVDDLHLRLLETPLLQRVVGLALLPAHVLHPHGVFDAGDTHGVVLNLLQSAGMLQFLQGCFREVSFHVGFVPLDHFQNIEPYEFRNELGDFVEEFVDIDHTHVDDPCHFRLVEFPDLLKVVDGPR